MYFTNSHYFHLDWYFRASLYTLWKKWQKQTNKKTHTFIDYVWIITSFFRSDIHGKTSYARDSWNLSWHRWSYEFCRSHEVNHCLAGTVTPYLTIKALINVASIFSGTNSGFPFCLIGSGDSWGGSGYKTLLSTMVGRRTKLFKSWSFQTTLKLILTYL